MPHRPDPRKQRARQLFEQGKLKQARGLYEKLCRHSPNDAESRYMLGSILAQQGQLPLAEKQFREALRIQPSVAILHAALGSVFRDQGKLADAESSFRTALRLNPGIPNVRLEIARILIGSGNTKDAERLILDEIGKHGSTSDAHHLLGELHHVRGNIQAALDHYHNAIRLQKNRVDTYYKLGKIFHSQGRLKEAEEHYRTAIGLAPSAAALHHALGVTLLTAGKLDEAESLFDKALKLDPRHINAQLFKITCLERRGQHETALKYANNLRTDGIIHPHLATILANLTRDRSRLDETLSYVDRVRNNFNRDSEGMEQMLFATGSMLDRLGEYEKAFSYYKEANDMGHIDFNTAEHFAFIDAVINVFNSSLLSRLPAASKRTPRQVFIIGMPRSGTSLTEQILGQHPLVMPGGERTDISNLISLLVKKTGDSRGYPFAITNDISSSDMEQAAEDYMSAMPPEHDGIQVLTDKMPQNFLYLGLISKLFPDARIIHCIRDPRDTCLSIYFQRFGRDHHYATRLEDIAAYYKTYQRLMKHWERVLDIPMFTLEYEQLVTAPETTISKLLSFLDLEWDDACLNFHTSKRFVATSSYEQVRRPFYTHSVKRWRNYAGCIASLLKAFESGDLT